MLACPKCQLKKKIETKKQRVQKAMTKKIGVKVRVEVRCLQCWIGLSPACSLPSLSFARHQPPSRAPLAISLILALSSPSAFASRSPRHQPPPRALLAISPVRPSPSASRSPRHQPRAPLAISLRVAVSSPSVSAPRSPRHQSQRKVEMSVYDAMIKPGKI